MKRPALQRSPLKNHPAGRASRALAVGLVAVLAGCTLQSPEQPNSPASSPTVSPQDTPTPESRTPSPVTTDQATGVADVVSRSAPSVVTVLVNGGNGSGVIYSEDGLILTNEHVVRGNRSVEIAFADGQRVAGAVQAVDEVTDLALVQAKRRNLPAAEFERKLPAVGSVAVVIGAPLGFQNSVTAGIVSGLHREIPGSASQGQSLVDLLQTDAPISPGNSGGAVFNRDGHVIGISEAYIPPQEGAVSLGFAIPAATAVDVAEQLRSKGRAEHAFAGLVPTAITPEMAQELGLTSTEGTIVADVAPGGPAGRAGVQPGDIITAVNDKPTPTPEDFLAEIRAHRPGDAVTFDLRRPGGKEEQARLTLSARPSTQTG
jgi:serine protease DegQ